MPSPHQKVCYHLNAMDTKVVRHVLRLLDDETLPMASWETTIEDIFLDLMSKNEIPNESETL